MSSNTKGTSRKIFDVSNEEYFLKAVFENDDADTNCSEEENDALYNKIPDQFDESDDSVLDLVQEDIDLKSLDILKEEDDEDKEKPQSKAKEVVEMTIEDAVLKYQNNIKESFDFIYGKYIKKLERVSQRERDEDLVQELSLALLDAVKTFNIKCGTKFNTYYWKCARNRIGMLKIRKNAQKRTAKNGIVSLQQTISSQDEIHNLDYFITDETSEEAFDKSLFYVVLKKHIFPHLNEGEKTAVEMYLEGYTLDEIGKVLGGISAPAIHVKIRRLAKKKEISSQLKMLYEMYCC